MKHKIKIEFEEEGTLEEILKCKKCEKAMKSVDAHSYKFDCTCQDESVRVSVG